MKKKVMGLTLFLCGVFCLVGCGSSSSGKLTCKITSGGADVTLTANFDGNKVDAMSIKYDMDLSSYSDSQVTILEKQDFCKSLKSSMSQFELTGCKQDISNKQLKVTSDIDISKMASTDLVGSKDETKKALEAMGFKCE